MIGVSELLTFRDEIVEDLGLTESPSDIDVAKWRREAIGLVGPIASATQEGAALFFVLSQSYIREFALVAVGAHLSRYDIEASGDDVAYLSDVLSRDIEDGLAFDDVLRWFESNIDRRRRR